MTKVKLSIFVITIFFNVFFTVDANDYCKFNCHGQPHTMCLYPSNTPSHACSNVISAGLTNQERQRIVNMHNKLRQQVANGLEKRGNPGPQPAAKYMPDLEWDSELEIIAQRWANQCEFGHSCNKVDRFAVGQNVVEKSFSAFHFAEVEDLIQIWYDEVEIFDARDVSFYKYEENVKIGHYTQIVWAKTTKIGCGLIKYEKNGWYTIYLVCNYGESGNRTDRKPVYERL